MRVLIALCLVAQGTPVLAETVFAKITLRPRDVIAEGMVYLDTVNTPGAMQHLDEVIGAEVRRAVYAGHPIMAENLTRAAEIERNQIVPATFSLNGLTIATEARALERGAVGDVIRAMNLTSRNTIRAEVLEGGTLKVLP